MPHHFDAIRLSEMKSVALLRRTDTKFLLSERQFFQALECLAGHYRVLEIDGRRLHAYHTLYFDTLDLALYRQHHNGWRNRYKVRERVYVDSDLSFGEVKHKVDANTTLKSRMRARALSVQIVQEAEPFLRAHYPYRVEDLEAKLANTFRRITLVSTTDVERLTVDLDLRFLLIKPEHRDQLLADLRERTGLLVTDCEVKRIDFLHDVAELQVQYEWRKREK